jgi:hypothetical protein
MQSIATPPPSPNTPLHISNSPEFEDTEVKTEPNDNAAPLPDHYFTQVHLIEPLVLFLPYIPHGYRELTLNQFILEAECFCEDVLKCNHTTNTRFAWYSCLRRFCLQLMTY